MYSVCVQKSEWHCWVSKKVVVKLTLISLLTHVKEKERMERQTRQTCVSRLVTVNPSPGELRTPTKNLCEIHCLEKFISSGKIHYMYTVNTSMSNFIILVQLCMCCRPRCVRKAYMYI